MAPQGPFTYEALPPEDIKFVPLKQTREFNAKELMEVGGKGGCWAGAEIALDERVKIMLDKGVEVVLMVSSMTC